MTSLAMWKLSFLSNIDNFWLKIIIFLIQDLVWACLSHRDVCPALHFLRTFRSIRTLLASVQAWREDIWGANPPDTRFSCGCPFIKIQRTSGSALTRSMFLYVFASFRTLNHMNHMSKELGTVHFMCSLRFPLLAKIVMASTAYGMMFTL